jgi:hypothetical protein
MQKIFVVVNHGGAKQAIADVSQSWQDDTLVGQTFVYHTDRHLDVWMVFHQLFQSGSTGHDANDVNLWHSPL